MSQKGQAIDLGDINQANIEVDRRIAGYQKTENGYICKKCGSTILQTTLYVSIWIKPFQGGFGEVKHYPFPYCPKCEGEPGIVRAHT